MSAREFSVTAEQLAELIHAVVNRPSDVIQVRALLELLRDEIAHLHRVHTDTRRSVEQLASQSAREGYERFIADNPAFGPSRPGHT